MRGRVGPVAVVGLDDAIAGLAVVGSPSPVMEISGAAVAAADEVLAILCVQQQAANKNFIS